MDKYDVIIKNGSLVLESGMRKADIGIKDGIIKTIQAGPIGDAALIYDANGQYVFPGMVDAHVHFNDPGREEWEGFKTGSAMLAAGGGTTFFDMPLNGIPSTTNATALVDKAKMGEIRSCVDFGLWGGLVPGNIEKLKSLAESGVVGFKAFMSPSGNSEFEAADDATLLAGMKKIAQTKKVLALHAENGPMVDFLKSEKEMRGQVNADDYAASRPIAAEVEAVQRAILYAEVTGCPLHFVHISSARAVEVIKTAREKGMDITVETCPHYLLFTHDDLKEKGPIAKCAPPLREDAEKKALIQLLMEDAIDMVASDHSPSPWELKENKENNMFRSWGGISGGQFTLLSMIELAITYQIPFEKVAKWTSSAPAKRFGLYPQKGELLIGGDADITIISLEEFMVTKEDLYAKHKQSLYEGHSFPCRVMVTFRRGELVYDARNGLQTEGSGKWLTPVVDK